MSTSSSGVNAMRLMSLIAVLFFAACSEELDTPDAQPAGDLGLWNVETSYDGCDSPMTVDKAPLMLSVEFREGDETSVGTAMLTQGTGVGAIVTPSPWGYIGETLWFLHLELENNGLTWDAGPVKLERDRDGAWVGAVSWHSEIGPRCRGTVKLTRP
jgi:hypothetical protein